MTNLSISDYEKVCLDDALIKVAQTYIEKARGWLKVDGKPKKGFRGLTNHYFQKADALMALSNKLGK